MMNTFSQTEMAHIGNWFYIAFSFVMNENNNTLVFTIKSDRTIITIGSLHLSKEKSSEYKQSVFTILVMCRP